MSGPGYPIELDLTGCAALVVGLGAVGRRKAAGLLAAGARVVGVDPSEGVDPGPALDGLELRREPYRATHLEGVRLAFAAATPGVNRRVVADARRAGVWVNSASAPGLGDFLVPAVWREGAITLTVSTGGASPALAAALRDRAAEALGRSAAGLAAVLAGLRAELVAGGIDPQTRRSVMASWSDPRWLSLFESGGAEAVRAEVRRLAGLG